MNFKTIYIFQLLLGPARPRTHTGRIKRYPLHYHDRNFLQTYYIYLYLSFPFSLRRGRAITTRTLRIQSDRNLFSFASAASRDSASAARCVCVVLVVVVGAGIRRSRFFPHRARPVRHSRSSFSSWLLSSFVRIYEFFARGTGCRDFPLQAFLFRGCACVSLGLYGSSNN